MDRRFLVQPSVYEWHKWLGIGISLALPEREIQKSDIAAAADLSKPLRHPYAASQSQPIGDGEMTPKIWTQQSRKLGS